MALITCYGLEDVVQTDRGAGTIKEIFTAQTERGTIVGYRIETVREGRKSLNNYGERDLIRQNQKAISKAVIK